jgi:hypothetical protein
MARSKHTYNFHPEWPTNRFPDWHHFTRRSPGKTVKRLFYKKAARAQLDGDMRGDPDGMSLTPWSKLTDYSWWW